MEKQLANIIRYHRKRSGLTQLELAEMSGVGKNMVYELENGKQSVQWSGIALFFKRSIWRFTLLFRVWICV